MRNTTVLSVLLAAAFMFMLSSCCQNPDLVIKNLEVDWNSNTQQVSFELHNIGTTDAGTFMVYINLEEDPESPNHRPQRREEVTGLAAGEMLEFTDLDLSYLAHSDNNLLGNVKAIEVLADPKNRIPECKEDNNAERKELPALYPDCILETNFESLAAGTTYPVGATISSDGMNFLLADFTATDGTTISSGNITVADADPDPAIENNQLFFTSINMELVLEEPVSYISMDVTYGGSNYNLNINGDSRNEEMWSLLGSFTFDGVEVKVGPIDEDAVELEFEGNITSFAIGAGQLVVDNICVI